MRFLLVLVFFLVPVSIALAQDTDEIGQEWNNSTSVEFPATSTDAEGNVIYNYYGDDSQYFGGDQNGEEPPAEAPKPEDGNLTLPLNNPNAGNSHDAEEGFLNSLVDSNAIEGDGLSQKDFDFFFGGGNDSSWSVTLTGSLVRDTLKKQGIQKITLEGWDPKKEDQNIVNWLPLTKGDLSLVAAAAVFRDSNIDEVRLTLKDFGIIYAFKAYLFYFIPFRMNAGITVNPERGAGNAVEITYPWYQFLLWKPIAKSALDQNLETTVSTALAIQAESTFEKQARVFGSVADALRAIQQP